MWTSRYAVASGCIKTGAIFSVIRATAGRWRPPMYIFCLHGRRNVPQRPDVRSLMAFCRPSDCVYVVAKVWQPLAIRLQAYGAAACAAIGHKKSPAQSHTLFCGSGCVYLAARVYRGDRTYKSSARSPATR